MCYSCIIIRYSIVKTYIYIYIHIVVDRSADWYKQKKIPPVQPKGVCSHSTTTETLWWQMCRTKSVSCGSSCMAWHSRLTCQRRPATCWTPSFCFLGKQLCVLLGLRQWQLLGLGAHSVDVREAGIRLLWVSRLHKSQRSGWGVRITIWWVAEAMWLSTWQTIGRPYLALREGGKLFCDTGSKSRLVQRASQITEFQTWAWLSVHARAKNAEKDDTN